MHDLHTKTALDKKALQFTYSRLHSLLRTLEITSLEEFNPLQDLANFATLVATYVDGFSVILEPRVNQPPLGVLFSNNAAGHSDGGSF
jgi:DNA excision repair protein ERCC-2